MIFTTAVIADIHFGAVRPDQLYNELRNEFLDFIENRYIDMIVIAGDFFNSILSLNSQSALRAFAFMKELMYICEKNDIKYVRIIEGTLSHDNYQILNFRMYESNPKVNFKIITTVTEETLDNGIKILHIPEEYMENPLEYYRPFIDKEAKYYDFIFGHGMFKETSFVKEDGENNISKAPIWDSKYLIGLSKGPIFFGHIHTSQIIRKHIYYAGSFSRWVYGQEEKKGFYLIAYDTDTSRYITQFIENKLAKSYDTIKVHLVEFIEKNHNLDHFIEMCKELKKDNLRIQILIESSEKDFSYELGFLKEYYMGKPGYKLDVIDKREKLQQERVEEKVNRLMNDYSFLFQKDIPIETKIHKFIKRKYSKDVSEDKIRDLLNLNIEKND